MNAIIILYVIGALLLAAEIFLPGVIAGIIGGIALLAGSVLSFREFGFGGGLAASTGALALVALMLYLELVVLPKTAFGQKLVVQAVVDATSQPPLASTGRVQLRVSANAGSVNASACSRPPLRSSPGTAGRKR